LKNFSTAALSEMATTAIFTFPEVRMKGLLRFCLNFVFLSKFGDQSPQPFGIGN